MNNLPTPADVASLFAAMLAMPFLMCGVLVVLLFFWIWMIVDCAMNDKLVGNDKVVWVLILIFTNWIGALIYFAVQRPKKKVSSSPAVVFPPPIQKPPPSQVVDPDKKYYENYGK